MINYGIPTFGNRSSGGKPQGMGLVNIFINILEKDVNDM